jgi:hypothetical protein
MKENGKMYTYQQRAKGPGRKPEFYKLLLITNLDTGTQTETSRYIMKDGVKSFNGTHTFKKGMIITSSLWKS